MDAKGASLHPLSDPDESRTGCALDGLRTGLSRGKALAMEGNEGKEKTKMA
jgi:hypothetical protein